MVCDRAVFMPLWLFNINKEDSSIMKKDVVIIGAGPAGIFTALEMIKKGSKKSIMIVEKGQAVENRHCPKDKTKVCVSCKPYCHITTGFSGAGAFSDGKLSLCYEVGGDLPTLIGAQTAQETIDYTDKIYLEFGADEHIEGLEDSLGKKEIRIKAIQAGLKLVDRFVTWEPKRLSEITMPLSSIFSTTASK